MAFSPGCREAAPSVRRPWDPLPRKEVKRLIAELRSENGDARLAAARSLGEAGEEQAVGPILKALRREPLSVGVPGVRALALIGDLKAAKPLLRIYFSPYDPPPDMPQSREIVPFMRALMLYALGSLQCTEAERVLVDRYKSETNLLFRARIAQGLGLLGTEEAYRTLSESVQDPSSEVRRLAVVGLGLVGDQRAAQAIQTRYDLEMDASARAFFLFVLSGVPVTGLDAWVRERLGPTSHDPRERTVNVVTRMRIGDDEAIRWRGAGLAAQERGVVVSEEPMPFPDLQFETASDLLTPVATAQLDEAMKAFAAEEVGASRIRIRGHTDNKGSEGYNLRLSRRRAEAVHDYLASHGLGPADRFEVTGLGESEPIAANDTDAGRHQNRRVEWSTVRQPADAAAAYLELKMVLQSYADAWRTTHREPQRSVLGDRLVRLARRDGMAPMLRALASKSLGKDPDATGILRAIRILAPGLIEQRLVAAPVPTPPPAGARLLTVSP